MFYVVMLVLVCALYLYVLVLTRASKDQWRSIYLASSHPPVHCECSMLYVVMLVRACVGACVLPAPARTSGAASI